MRIEIRHKTPSAPREYSNVKNHIIPFSTLFTSTENYSRKYEMREKESVQVEVRLWKFHLDTMHSMKSVKWNLHPFKVLFNI